MRVLVTGAAGFLGRHVTDELARRGDEVLAVVRPSRELSGAQRRPGVERVEADLRRPGDALRRAAARADAVIHLAATTSGNWRAMFDATVLTTENLLEAMRESGFAGRLVHVSSFALYGLNQVPRRGLVDEATPLERHPERRGDYAWTKWIQERLVRELRSRGEVEVTIVRPGVIYGRERRFQHQLGRELGTGLLLYGGRNTMRLNYVGNTASLLAEAARNPGAAGEVFNAIDPRPLKQWEYARRWRRSRTGGAAVVPVPLSAFMLTGRLLEEGARASGGRVSPPSFLDPYLLKPAYEDFRYDTSRATRLLGWAPPVGRDQALERTFAPEEAQSGPLS